METIFLYNSELWTLTKKLEDTVDIFQRTFLRRILGVTWRDKISNVELLSKTKQNTWSTKIKERRLHWYGHLLRLPSETPAKKALEEAKRPAKKPRGKPKYIWIKQIEKDLCELNMSELEIYETACDRKRWRTLVSNLMSN